MRKIPKLLKTHQRTASLFAIISCILSMMLSVFAFLSPMGVFPKFLWRTRPIAVTQISHENGNCYIAILGDSTFSSEKGPSVARLLEDNMPLPSANVLHEHIRKYGNGRFSFWQEYIYFSSSDNTSPLTNGRKYAALVPMVLPLAWAVYGLTLGLMVVCYLKRKTIAKNLAISHCIPKPLFSVLSVVWSVSRWLYVNVLPGLAITLALLATVAIIAEIYLRIILPFNAAVWPNQFDPRYGFNFVPGTIVRHTNYADYWVEGKVNSIGFLDREPPREKKRGICRVLFIGDSLVEAAQVPMEKKSHIVFEGLANQANRKGRRIESVALGYAGTGQANQIPFYDVFGKSFEPDVVVLIFTGNDFSNNSTVLESLRNGWNPLHPPRFFFERESDSSHFKIIPIDPKWRDYLLPSASGEQGTPHPIITWLSRETYLYNWLYGNFLRNSPRLSSWLSGYPISRADVFRHRIKEIKKIEKYKHVFEGWELPHDDLDSIFAQEEMPLIFKDAVAATGYALDEFLERSRRDGFQLLAVSSSQLSTQLDGRRLAHIRLKQLTSERNIPLIDQYGYIASKKLNQRDVSFRYDRHWNEQGHRWAAEALLEYFQSHPELCR